MNIRSYTEYVENLLDPPAGEAGRTTEQLVTAIVAGACELAANLIEEAARPTIRSRPARHALTAAAAQDTRW